MLLLWVGRIGKRYSIFVYELQVLMAFLQIFRKTSDSQVLFKNSKPNILITNTIHEPDAKVIVEITL